MTRLTESFYRTNDVVKIAKDLLGQILVTRIDGNLTAAIITETEAYHQTEKACHAYNGRRTARTEILFHQGGYCYVYLCYGIHNLFNVVTGEQGEAAAVLIRAAQPVLGLPLMMDRRAMRQPGPRVSAGPGNLSQALGLTLAHNKTSLINDGNIWIESGEKIPPNLVRATKRIGVDYAKEDASLPWRFYVKGSKWISKS